MLRKSFFESTFGSADVVLFFFFFPFWSSVTLASYTTQELERLELLFRGQVCLDLQVASLVLTRNSGIEDFFVAFSYYVAPVTNLY